MEARVSIGCRSPVTRSASPRAALARAACWIAAAAAVLLAIPVAALGHAGAHTSDGPGTSATHSAAHSSGRVFEGTYVLRHSDDFAAAQARFDPRLKTDAGRVLRLDFDPGARPRRLSPGDAIRVRGERRRGSIQVADGSTTAAGSATSTTLADPSSQRVAVVLFTFSNNPTQPYSPSVAAGVAFNNSNSVAAYYDETSWGRVAVSGDVYGWYTIPNTNTSCDVDAWATSAKQAAADAGVDLSAYDHIVYGFPSASSCGWNGLADMPGREAWLNGSGGMTLRTMAHELGHNFGTHHAASLNCTESGTRVGLSATAANCTLSEYGDPFTIMGGASRYQQTNFARGNFGWLSSANTRAVTGSGQYTLQPVEVNDPNGVNVLQIPRTASTYLTLEYRQPSGSYFDTFSLTDPVANGVSVRVTSAYTTRSRSQLVDSTPSTSSFADAPLGAGKTLVDPLSGVSITTTSTSFSGAEVRVAIPTGGTTEPPPDTSAPSQPANANAAALDASRVSLTWSASTDNVGVSGYRIYRNGALVASTSSTSFTDTGLAPETSYAYEVVAVDSAGNASSPATASATTAAADTTAPSAPTNLTASLGKRKKVSVAWQASTDDTGVVAYRVYRSGAAIATTGALNYSDTLPGKTSAAKYWVVAVDAAGNVSPSSNAVSVG